jgi:CrcB protein
MPFSPAVLGLVFVGGGIGALIRLFVGALVTEWTGSAFPFGTLLINITGSAVMGVAFVVVAHVMEDRSTADLVRFFCMTGILGGYTTFSAFSLDAFALYTRGEVTAAAAYVLGSVVLSIVALFVTAGITRSLLA